MKAAARIRKFLGTSVVTKSRLGFLIALVVAVTIVGKAAITYVDALQRNSPVICIAVGLAGFLSWGTGRWAEARRAQLDQGQDAPLAQDAAEHPLAFLYNGKYWGIILMLSGAMLTFIVTRSHPQPVLEVRARPQITNSVIITVTNMVTITNAKPVVTFPPLALAGLVVNGAKSSALINGRVLYVGETISNVVLVAVDGEHALVALEGQTKVLSLRQ